MGMYMDYLIAQFLKRQTLAKVVMYSYSMSYFTFKKIVDFLVKTIVMFLVNPVLYAQFLINFS